MRHLPGLPVLFGLGALLTCGLFSAAVFSEDVFIERDVLRVYYPLKQYWAQRVSALELPQWYPFDGLGQPFLGMTISGPLHPTNLLYLPLSLGLALKLSVLLCYPAAFAGAARLWRRLGHPVSAQLLAGSAYAFCGYALGMTNNPLYLQAMATLPWAVLGADLWFSAPTRRWSALLAAAGAFALILFAGDVMGLSVALVAVSLLAWRQRGHEAVSRWLLLVLAVAALGAAQWMPAAAVMGESVGADNRLESALLWSTHPLRLLELGVGPLFLDASRESLADPLVAGRLLSAGTSESWAASHFIGALPVVLALVGLAVGRARRLWAPPLGLLVLLWLGKHVLVFGWVHDFLPLGRLFRFPEKLSPFIVLALVLLAGEALLWSERSTRPVVLWRVLAGASAVAVLANAAEALAGLYARVLTALVPELPGPLLSSLSTSFLVATALAAGTLAIAALVQARGSPAVRALGLTLLGFGSLWFAHHRAYVLAPPEILQTPPASLAPLLDELATSRARVFALPPPAVERPEGLTLAAAQSLSDYQLLQPVVPALWGIEGSTVYLPAFHRNAQRYQRAPRLLAPVFDTAYSLLPVALGRARAKDGFVPLTALGGQVEVGRELRRVPRAFLAHRRCVPTQDDALRQLSAGSGDWGLEALIVCQDAGGASDSTAPLGNARILARAPEEVLVEVDATREAMLVLNDAYYSGWSATLDGEPAPIELANLMVRAVQVPQGKHQVRFRYTHPGLGLGLLTSGLGLLLGLGLVLVQRRARPTPSLP